MENQEQDFIVYDTDAIEVTKNENGKILKITCLIDNSYFELGRTIGKGSFGVVKLASRNWKDEAEQLQSQQFALKILNKTVLKKQRNAYYSEENQMQVSNNLEKVYREISIWRQLNIKNIIRLYEVIDDPTHENIYLVIELAEHGCLMDWDTKQGKYLVQYEVPGSNKEQQAQLIAVSILNALVRLHEKNICHRDIKPDNIMVAVDKETNQIIVKLSDFSVSKQLSCQMAQCYDTGGTVAFQSPESMISGQGYDGFMADMWALGVTLHTFLNDGIPPFWDPSSEMQTQLLIQSAQFKMPPSISQPCQEFLSKLMQKEYFDRMTAEEALKHVWIKDFTI